RPVPADHRLTRGDHRDGKPPEDTFGDERHHGRQHQALVGERIEERARGRRAVAAGDVPVEAVGAGENHPERERPPRRRAGEHDDEKEWRGREPAKGDGVGRRRQRGLPKPRPPRGHYAASRSGPAAPVTVTVANWRGVWCGGSETIPSISGA